MQTVGERAIVSSPDPMGSYHRYEFLRSLFPDYPRPAVWPDGYYVPTSTGDDVVQKHACVVDRARMLAGEPATEQCFVLDGVNFLNNADVGGPKPPPPGSPNIMMATGGTQLDSIFHDDAVYVWQFRVDWENPEDTRISGPERVPVAPYEYLCDGQLSSCVPQPGTDQRLDSQGDKMTARLADDPMDDCTIWYVGDYLRRDAPSYSTRIGAFQLPGCSAAEAPARAP